MNQINFILSQDEIISNEQLQILNSTDKKNITVKGVLCYDIAKNELVISLESI